MHRKHGPFGWHAAVMQNGGPGILPTQAEQEYGLGSATADVYAQFYEQLVLPGYLGPAGPCAPLSPASPCGPAGPRAPCRLLTPGLLPDPAVVPVELGRAAGAGGAHVVDHEYVRAVNCAVADAPVDDPGGVHH
jgi:hypothetical protein